MGEVRPIWGVLAELAERCGAGLDVPTSAMVTGELVKAVPFYDGLTLEEIGGKGVRWQDRDAASRLPAAELPDAELAQPPELPEGVRLGVATSLWSGPTVENSPSLRFLAPDQRAELAPADAHRLGVTSGDEVEVAAGGETVRARVALRQAMQPGSVFLVAGTATDNAHALTNGAPRTVEVRKRARSNGRPRRGSWPPPRADTRPPDGAARPGPGPGDHARPAGQGGGDLRLHPAGGAADPAARAQAARALPVALRAQPRGLPRSAPAAGRRGQAVLQGELHARHRGAVDDGHRAGDLGVHRRGHAGDHPVRPAGRLGRRPRPVRHRRADRAALLLRLRLAGLLRLHARRLGLGIEVLVPRRDALGRAADLLRGGDRPVAARAWR